MRPNLVLCSWGVCGSVSGELFTTRSGALHCWRCGTTCHRFTGLRIVIDIRPWSWKCGELWRVTAGLCLVVLRSAGDQRGLTTENGKASGDYSEPPWVWDLVWGPAGLEGCNSPQCPLRVDQGVAALWKVQSIWEKTCAWLVLEDWPTQGYRGINIMPYVAVIIIFLLSTCHSNVVWYYIKCTV